MLRAEAIRSHIRSKVAYLTGPFTREMSIPSQQHAERIVQPLLYTAATVGFLIGFYFQSYAIAVYTLAGAYLVALALIVPCWQGLWKSVDEDETGDLPFVPQEAYAAYLKQAKKDPRNAPGPASTKWYAKVWSKTVIAFKYVTKRKVQ